MNRLKLIVIVFAIALVGVACGAQAAPTAVPTAEPLVESTPTFESAQVPEGTTPLDTIIFEVDPNLVEANWAWVQRTENGGTEVLITVPDPGSYTLFFNTDGTFDATIDCNSAGGAYATDGNGNIFMELGSTTMAACPPESLSQDMINMFGPAQSYVYENDGDTLIFKWAAGGPWDYYEKVSQDLANSSWEVVGYNNGKEAVTSVINGTQITANFGADGEMTGSASCNDYFGPYETDESNITMGPFGTTRKACPEDIMEQESQYLAALESAATYQIDGNMMNMRTANGATAVNMQKASAAANGATVFGMVTNADDSPIPQGATATIQIQDTSLADAPATVIGEQIIEDPGSFPFAYAVPFDPNEIVDNHTYTMSARITAADGSLLFINDTAIPVITNGNPTEAVEIPVIQTGG